MQSVTWALLLKPFVLFAFLGFCLCVRYAVIWWFPQNRLKQILLHSEKQPANLTRPEMVLITLTGIGIVYGVSLVGYL